MQTDETAAMKAEEAVGKAVLEQAPGAPTLKCSPGAIPGDLEAGAGDGVDATAAAAARSNEQQPVALRVELATKGLAQFMQFMLWGLMLLLFLLSIVLVVEKDNIQGDGIQPRSGAYHKVLLGVSIACTATLLFVAALYVSRSLQTFKSKMEWSRRHKALAIDAAVVQGLVLVQCIFWVAPMAAVVGADCTWPTVQVAAYNMVRSILFITLMFWMLIMMHSMNRRVRPPKKGHRCTWCLWGAAPHRKGCKGCSAAADKPSEAAAAAKGRAEISLSADQPVQPETVGMDATGQGAPRPSNSEVNGRCQQQQQQQQQAVQGSGASEAGNGNARAAAAAFEEAEVEGLLLCIDRPWREQLLLHLPKLAIWLVVVVITVLEGAKQIQFGEDVPIPISAACEQQLGLAEGSSAAQYCGLNTQQRVSGLVQAIIILLYFLAYLFYQHRALKGHASLPYVKYRMTNLYIRVQARHGSVVIASVVLSVIVQRAASTGGSCWSFLEGQLGSLSVQLAIGILALVSAILYLPLGGVGATLLQNWLQEFAWCEASQPMALARRAAALRALAATERRSAVEQHARALLRTLLPHVAPLLNLQSSQRALEVAEQELQLEPMLCVETVLRLFYWSRLAYACQGPAAYVNAMTGLSLLGLSHNEVLHEPATETLCIVGWGGPGNPRLVLSFRGTANLQNALTDIKFFKTPHLPRRHWHGQLVEVHTGFYKAWREGGFSERLLARVAEVVGCLQVDPSRLDFLITGHSLGGALATLAALEVRRAYPDARIRVYTFGGPRVGNGAFAGEYNQAVRDHWSLVNYNDPVPRIPKGFYKRNGQRVTLNPMGDLIIRPSYFELAVLLKRGGTVKDHLTGTYALALAAVLKAQFSPAKRLPGGEEGVRALLASLDVGEALVLRHCDLGSLQDPDCLPERLEEDPKKKKSSGGIFKCCAGKEAELAPEQHESASRAPSAAAAAGGPANGSRLQGVSLRQPSQEPPAPKYDCKPSPAEGSP